MSSISTSRGAKVTPNKAIGVSDAFGKMDLRVAYQASSREDLGAMRRALSGQPQDPKFHLPGSVFVHSICAADVSRAPAGHGGIPPIRGACL